MCLRLIAAAAVMVALGACGDDLPRANEDGVPYLQESLCDDGGDCPEAYQIAGRDYAVGCDTVRTELVADLVAIRDDSAERAWAIPYAEARRIRGADPASLVAMGPAAPCGVEGDGDEWHWASSGPVDEAVLCRVLANRQGC